jgi:N-acetyl-1-D-myo-inositol-2-amino-2-deoxy-alpha-D-glucopyranoside deacetylase
MTGADARGADGRRLLLVHAHPDDETLTTGATIARYAAEGVEVTVVTCTLGEEGENLVPELGQLTSAYADQLGGHRMHEMAAAMAALGVRDHRWLGGAGRFRDSGMAGWPSAEHPRALWRADSDPAVFDEAVTYLEEIVREVRPHAVVTYDPRGGYGHPDHIITHRVATEAVARAAVGRRAVESADAWPEARLYWVVTPRSALERELELAAAQAPPQFLRVRADDLPSADDGEATTVVEAEDHVAAQLASLTEHRTQVAVSGRTFALSNDIARYAMGREYFRRALGARVAPLNGEGLEEGLFAAGSESAAGAES